MLRRFGEGLISTILFIIAPSAYFISKLPAKEPAQKETTREELYPLNTGNIGEEIRTLNRDLPLYTPK